LRTATALALFVAVFLFIFEPFGTGGMDWKWRTLNALIFGLVRASGILIWGALNFFMVALLNYATIAVLSSGSVSFGFVGALGATFLVGFFPYVVLLLLDHARMLRSMLSGAENVNAWLDGHPVTSHSSERLTFKGKQEGEEVHLVPDTLVCIRSAGNYVELFEIKGGEVKTHVLRCSMSSAEHQLTDHVQFFRSHRSCILNLDLVEHVEGNAQGYLVRLRGLEENVPVSRAKVSEFDERLTQR